MAIRLRCLACGTMYDPARGHSCDMANRVANSPELANMANSPGGEVANRVANTVANGEEDRGPVSGGGGVVRSSTYRHRDPEARRAYMRDLMRRKRAGARRRRLGT